MHGVNRNDTAKYTCKITNKYGSNEDYGEMYVRCSPQFRSRLTDQKAKEGDTDVEFNVNIQAFPKPLVRWYVSSFLTIFYIVSVDPLGLWENL